MTPNEILWLIEYAINRYVLKNCSVSLRISPNIGIFRKLILLKLGVVSEFIRELQSYEEYSFSLDELREKTNAPESSIRKELNRLGKDKQILILEKAFI